MAGEARLLLAVPNVSEGRELGTLEAIERSLAPARFLDLHTDPDHDRSVFTIAARQGDMAAALLGLARSAVARIDVSAHTGIHPHVGALDVMPVVYLDLARRGAAAAEAPGHTAAIGEELGVPVFLYGELATRPEHAERAFSSGAAAPASCAADRGQGARPRLRAAQGSPQRRRRPGRRAAAARGVQRGPGDAGSRDRALDRLGLRESGGGFPGCGAIGLYLADRAPRCRPTCTT